MRFFLAAAAIIPTVYGALVQRQASLPSCAATCLATADFGSCDSSDYGCLCSSDKFISSVSSCITSSCSGDDLASATTVSTQLCAAAGVTLSNLPTGSATASGSSTQSSATGSAASSSSTSQPDSAISMTFNTGALLFAVGFVAYVL
ncbi:hypothetical protein CYLTODRAFT_417203 [Cylindrobasidium torrendii FP15055 ss-10]|uniref:CFEM domain-containing protein n=1 Tax=Cylindrobasidium torrendii FP15055 ss-10 TaxID=1314674 RepID=A0A0D7BSV0_9AGAR|nr:hypothetical protein CYLTODRAFT_417203 [Cylindrobasidium torrendii FP15055 ss-10]